MTDEPIHIPMVEAGLEILKSVQPELLRLLQEAFDRAMALPDTGAPGGVHSVALSAQSHLTALSLTFLMVKLRDVYPTRDVTTLWTTAVTDIQLRAAAICHEMGLDWPSLGAVQ
ncbi:MAG: hypothetical protein BGP16_05365 [Sphingobium sp. 66-54]|nr:MAG: hypothetical protein BGP16_05365 [Sphingobium sp. 66-54]